MQQGQSGINVWFYNSTQIGAELKNKQLKSLGHEDEIFIILNIRDGLVPPS